MSEPIKNAEEIIKRFGGIRPMASKMDVPVTTVQGWKKRDAVPFSRKDELLAAATEHKVDLSDLLIGAPDVSNDEGKAEDTVEAIPDAENDGTGDRDESNVDETDGDKDVSDSEIKFGVLVDSDDDDKEETEEATEAEAATSDDDDDSESRDIVRSQKPPVSALVTLESTRTQGYNDGPGPGPSPRQNNGGGQQQDYGAMINDAENRAIKASSIISVLLVFLIALGSALFFWPKVKGNEQRIISVEGEVQQLRGDIQGVQQDQKTMSGNWKDQLAALKDQMGDSQKMLEDTVRSAKNASSEIMSEGFGGVQRRYNDLENYVNDVADSNMVFGGLVKRLNYLFDSEGGQKQVSETGKEMLSYFLENPKATEDDLHAALDENPAMAETFKGVPAKDMEAAAILFSLSQLRYALSRDNVPYEDDLLLALTLVDQNDKELMSALERLTPQAEKGVFTPEHLSKEFSGIAGEVVAASLKGEDITLSEKAQARLNDVFQLEKDGELVTGTDTQSAVNKAQAYLEEGNVEEALKILETLPKDEQEPLDDWKEKAQGTVKIQQSTNILEKAIGGLTGGANILGSGVPMKRQGLSVNGSR